MAENSKHDILIENFKKPPILSPSILETSGLTI